jgi:hypothetical protein
LFFWNKLGFLQDMASVRPSSATQEGFLFLLNEYKALVCYICLSQSRQSPITTRGKIHHLIGSGGGVLNPHAVLSICVIGQAIFAYIEYASKSFFLQLNCAIRKIVALIIILPSFHPLYELFILSLFFSVYEKWCTHDTTTETICKSDKLQKLQQKYGFFLLQLDLGFDT